MSTFIPAGATARDSAVDLACTPCPAGLVTSPCVGFFLITRGRGDVSISLDGICVTEVRCMRRGGTTTAGAGGTRTRVRAGGRRFSFPLTLLLIASCFLCTEEASTGVLFSAREKLDRVVDSRRRDGCRAGGGPRVLMLWGRARDSTLVLKRSGLVSTDAGGVGYGVSADSVLAPDEDVSLCSGVRKEGCTDGDGIREGEHARRMSNSGGGRLRLAAGCGTREGIEDLLVSDDACGANS
jgi:hypothetical protein